MKRPRKSGKAAPRRAAPVAGASPIAVALLMTQAAQAHRQGQLDQAERTYRAVLAAQPGHFDALNWLGYLCFQQGRLAEARPHLVAAVAQRPTDIAALSNLAAALIGLGEPQPALAAYDAVLAFRPGQAEALRGRGDALIRLGRPADAVASYDAALALEPHHAQALNNRGGALVELGQPTEALASFDRALAVSPEHVSALFNRGAALMALGRCEAALRSYDRAIALAPTRADAWISSGNALKALKRPLEALQRYDQALILSPGSPQALNNRASVLLDLKRPAEALASCDQALAANPHMIEALINRGNAQRDLGRAAEALAAYDQVILLRPDFAEPHNNRANALKDLGRSDQALAAYDRAIALRPDYAEAFCNKSVLLTELGQLSAAAAAARRAIALDPGRIRAYYNLTLATSLAADDPILAALDEAARDAKALPDIDQIDLHFTLGKALADQGDHPRAFEHLARGNAIKRRAIAYDEAASLAALAELRAAFSAEALRSHAGQGHATPVPVFIVGMPRSGTSLVEQILASHPQAHGAGEIGALEETLEQVGGALPLTASRLATIGAAYLDRIRGLAPTALRIVNKTPDNIRLAGLIHLALPQARIIHTRRDPVDTCLSCFSKQFVGDLPYAYDLAELGRYYRAYDELAAHWRAVLPSEALLEVQYEAVVADLEGQTRRILAHCGLDWDPACLAFHQTQRPVRTASAAQVRQPLYTGSVGRSRDYGDWLAPLIAALNGEDASGGA